MPAEAPVSEPGLVVHFELTRADLLAFYRHNVRHDRRIQQPLLIGYPLAVALAALLAFAQSLGDGGMELQAFFTALPVAAGGLFLAYPLFLYFYPRVLVQQTASVPGALGSHAVEVFPSGLTHLSRVAEGCHEWTAVREIVSAPGGLYFEINHFQTVIVPRGAFHDTDDFHRFLAKAHYFRDQALQRGTASRTSGSQMITIPEGAMVVDYELKATDIHTFVRYHLTNRGRRLASLALLGMASLGAWALNGGVVGAVLAAVAGALVLWVLVPLWVLRRMCELPGVLGPRVLAFCEEGIIGWTEALGDGTLTWSGIYDLAETPRHLYLYYGPATAIVVPTRAFEAPEVLDQFLVNARGWIRAARGQKP